MVPKRLFFKHLEAGFGISLAEGGYGVGTPIPYHLGMGCDLASGWLFAAG